MKFINKQLILGILLIIVSIAGILVSYSPVKTAPTPSQEVPPIVLEDSVESSDNVVLLVDVQGAVQKPGVVSLSSGARVDDALNAAEGVSGDVDLRRIEQGLNRAEWLKDGDKLYIPRVDDTDSVAGLLTLEVDAQGSSTNGSININNVTKQELVAAGLYRITERLADEVITYRNSYGPFSAVEDLLLVPGIGEGILQQIRNRISIGE